MDRTLVTAFVELNRGQWKHHARSTEEYFQNAKHNFDLDENMIIFVEKENYERVKYLRYKYDHKTLILVIDKSKLPKWKYYDRVNAIMTSEEFQSGLAYPSAPEMWNVEYLLFIWSKMDLINYAIKLNHFKTSHFAWFDFGLNSNYQLESIKDKEFHDKLRLLCRSKPQITDLKRITMCKSHTNRFAAGWITGHADYFIKFKKLCDAEILIMLNFNVVDCEQTVWSNVYLEHKELFDLYYGNWKDIITGY